MPSYSANVTLTFNTEVTCSANNPREAKNQILDSLNIDDIHLNDFDLDVNISLEEQEILSTSGYTSMSSLLTSPQETFTQQTNSYTPLRSTTSSYAPLRR